MELKTLVGEVELKERIKHLADEINKTYGADEPIVAICVLKAPLCFFASL